MTARVCIAAALACLAAPAARAQGSPPAQPARQERAVHPGARGPNRLAVDSALLVGASPLERADSRGARAGLGELRLHDDARGVDVPYLFVWPSPAAPDWLGTEPIAVTPRKDTSGFELDFFTPRLIDRFDVPELRERVLKRVRLEGSTDRVHWIVLVDDGTIFNLPAEGDVGRPLRQTELAFPPVSVRFVRLTADDHAGAPLPLPRIASVRLASRNTVERDTLRSVLSFERRPGARRTSRYHVTLPASRLPIVALELDAGGAQLLRVATVTEPRLGNGRVEPVSLGQAMLRRTTIGDAVASDLRIPIRSPSAAELDVVVDDGDNPPLDLRAVRAVYGPLPFIYFESASGGDLRATFGTDRRESVAPPRYDLEALRDTVQRIAAATATWGPARGLVAAAASRAEAPSALHADPGAPLDAAAFRFVRALPVGEGLTAVRLDPSVLAHSRIDDVRILDPKGRQVPYLLEHLDEPTVVPLDDPTAVQPRRDVDSRVLAGAGAMTWYRLALPYGGLPDATLRLETSARVFDRALAVVTRELPRDAAPQHGADRAVPAQWTHDDPDAATPPIEIALGGRLPGDSLFVVVNDGDNQKLPLARPTLLLPSYRLRFFRQAGVPLRLAYGRADLATPRYDLALIAPRLLDAPATEVTAAPEPGSAPATRVPQLVFWIVLGVAVLALLGLVARLVRAGPTVAGDAG